MSRIRADFLLLLTALIWGGAFVAQKNAFSNVGACTFVAARFFLSALLVLPLAVKEYRRICYIGNISEMVIVCVAFCMAVLLQQFGIGKTSVAHAGFLTGLYVLFVPLICTFIYKQKLSGWIFPAALLSLGGTWLLSSNNTGEFSYGDMLIFFCAICFALQVTLVGRIMGRIKSPFCLSFIQYATVASVSAIGAFAFEHPTTETLQAAVLPIIYAGAISGGIAYTLQMVAQQYAPASDSAIILSSEAIFAAIAGAWLLGEHLTSHQYFGCGLITFAIILTEFAPHIFKKNIM